MTRLYTHQLCVAVAGCHPNEHEQFIVLIDRHSNQPPLGGFFGLNLGRPIDYAVGAPNCRCTGKTLSRASQTRRHLRMDGRKRHHRMQQVMDRAKMPGT